MSVHILLGNIISLGGAICLTLSCLTPDPERAYVWQIGESLFLSASSICFRSWSGLITLLLSVLRNWLAMHQRLTLSRALFFCALTVILGFLMNTRGIVGMLPVVATVELTYTNYKAHTIGRIRLGFLINILLWMVYSYMILDLVSGVTQTISAICCIISLCKIRKRP